MTTINDIADLVRILQDDPAWAEAVRSVLLSQELLRMPEEFANFARTVRENSETVNWRLDRLESDVADLKAGQARLEEGQAQLLTGMNRMRGEIGNLMGSDFQRRAGIIAVRFARRDFRLQDATVVHQAGQHFSNTLGPVLDKAVDDGSIAFSHEDALDVELTDAIVAGQDQNGNDTYLLMEASVTVMEDDVARARERADLLEKAAGTATQAVVIGAAITEEAARLAQEQRVTFIPFDPRRPRGVSPPERNCDHS